MYFEPQVLENKNYTRYKDIVLSTKEWYEISFQKAITDKKGKKYFINMHQYNLAGHVPAHLSPRSTSVESRIYLTEEKYIEVEYHGGEICNLQEVEDFYENLWITLAGVHDPHN